MIFYRWQLFTLCLTFAMLLCLVGSYDYDEELASQSLYCDMTTEGSWPAYDKDVVCKD